MGQRRHGLRDLKPAWKTGIGGGGFAEQLQFLGTGAPLGPGSSHIATLSWEISYPAIVHGTDADWSSVYASSQYGGAGNAYLNLFDFAAGLERLGSTFTKHNLAILDATIFFGSQVTDVNASYNTNKMAATIYVDDEAAGYVIARQWTDVWPNAAPVNPHYTSLNKTLATVDNCPVLLSSTRPRAYLKLHDTHASTDFDAGRIRLALMVTEI